MNVKKAKSTDKSYVYHPRYGNKPTCSGQMFTMAEIRRAHWRYESVSLFPESAIAADTSKQNYSEYPRRIYVDIEKQCTQCHRWFIFYAQEQKFWFETLHFYVDSDCTKCVTCRKQEKNVKCQLKQYELLSKSKNRSEKETHMLKQVALELFQKGYIRNKNKIDCIL